MRIALYLILIQILKNKNAICTLEGERMSTHQLPTDFPSTEGSENQLKSREDELSKIQKDIDTLIESIANNPSVLSRVSRYWGNISLWKKIITGVALTVPLLLIGLFFQQITCVILSITIALGFAGLGYVFDDHHKQNQHNTLNIKSGVFSLAEGLDLIKNALKRIRDALSDQIGHFTQENTVFEKHVGAIGKEGESLAKQVERLKLSEKKLASTVNGLSDSNQELKKELETQSKLLDESQAELNRARAHYTQSLQELQTEIERLNELNNRFSDDSTNSKAIAQALRQSHKSFLEVMSTDAKTQAGFLGRLDAFINGKDPSLLQLTESVSEANKRCDEYQKRLQSALNECEQLLKRNKGLVSQLETLVDNNQPPSPLTTSPMPLFNHRRISEKSSSTCLTQRHHF
jgi:DNA repair exonuclease SbcCD ATPase subunit